jgi:hypothetical protein
MQPCSQIVEPGKCVQPGGVDGGIRTVRGVNTAASAARWSETGAVGQNKIIPDDRDWTWVLERECPECGFDAGKFDATVVGDEIRANASAWGVVLDNEAGRLRERRVASRWSDLEYAAHVRDVYRLYLDRLRLMLRDDDPLFANWDQDRTAIEERYASQDPAMVSRELFDAAHRLAEAFDGVRVD